jgi:hypothetical protein
MYLVKLKICKASIAHGVITKVEHFVVELIQNLLGNDGLQPVYNAIVIFSGDVLIFLIALYEFNSFVDVMAVGHVN